MDGYRNNLYSSLPRGLDLRSIRRCSSQVEAARSSWGFGSTGICAW